MRLSSLLVPLVSTLPIPVYFDLYTYSLISIDPRQMYTGEVGGASIFPVPLCLLAFPALIISLRLLSLNPGTLPLISFPYISLFRYPSYFLLIVYLFLCTRFELIGLIKGVQLLFPFLITPLFPVFNFSLRLGIFFTRVYLYSVVSFISLHILSYFFYTESIYADPISRFTAFWDLSIYSAHVSWSSYLGVLLAFLILFYLINTISFSELLSSFIIVFLELILSTRRDPLISLASFFSALLLFLLWRVSASMRLSWPALLLGLSFAFIVPVIFYSSESHLLHLNRIFDLSDRLDIWEGIRAALYQSRSFILFGMMFPYNNLHSYPISLFYSYGFIGVSLICFSVASFLKLFSRINNLSLFSPRFNGFPAHILVLSILFAVIPSNLVNVSLSQPFYLLNLAFLFLIFQSSITSRSPLLHSSFA
jgi:hypothetical protein